jgi:hypothetical protein
LAGLGSEAFELFLKFIRNNLWKLRDILWSTEVANCLFDDRADEPVELRTNQCDIRRTSGSLSRLPRCVDFLGLSLSNLLWRLRKSRRGFDVYDGLAIDGDLLRLLNGRFINRWWKRSFLNTLLPRDRDILGLLNSSWGSRCA